MINLKLVKNSMLCCRILPMRSNNPANTKGHVVSYVVVVLCAALLVCVSQVVDVLIVWTNVIRVLSILSEKLVTISFL